MDLSNFNFNLLMTFDAIHRRPGLNRYGIRVVPSQGKKGPLGPVAVAIDRDLLSLARSTR